MMTKISYSCYRFPSEIIQQAIWLYLRFTLSLRNVEDLLAERGIMVSYETVRRWVTHFGPLIAADLRKRRAKPHTTWHLDEIYLKIAGRMVYLWRAVDAEGEVLDVLIQSTARKTLVHATAVSLFSVATSGTGIVVLAALFTESIFACSSRE
jgi:putative transposase